MTDAFRLILVGAGQIVTQAHLPAALGASGVRVTAIVDPAVERASALTRKFGMSARAVADVGDVIGDADGAVIATPGSTHYEIATKCLEHGLHVLVEKPMTATYEEAVSLQRLADDRKRTLAVGYVTRYWRSTRILKSLLEQRYFGRINRFAHQFGTVGGWSPAAGYEVRRGGGVLAVSGSHFMDRMLWFWGYPSELEYVDDGDFGPEANCVGRVGFADGMRGVFRYSKTTTLPGGLVLDTEIGRVSIADSTEEIVLRPKDASGFTHTIRPAALNGPAAEEDPFALQLQDFVRSCRTGQAPLCPASEGAMSMKLIDQLYASRRPFETDWYTPDIQGSARCA